MPQNPQIHLVSRPTGEPTADNFNLLTLDAPALQDRQVLVKHEYMSLDPYMRGRMNDGKSYTAPQALNAVMVAGTVGEVVESRHPDFAVGDKVVGMGGWQSYSVVDADVPAMLRKVDTTHVPISHFLGAVGMPGVTAWHGLVRIINPKAGQTMTVSAASGAVGSAFGALAKARGCRVVGFAGGQDKCDYVVNELGFDACIDYKVHSDYLSLSKALKDACPNGIDGHFENVGGMVLDAVMLRMNQFGSIAVCGMIAGYNGKPIPMTNPSLILMSRLKVQGFIVSEHPADWPEALKELGAMVGSGKFKPRETVAHGLANAPEAFFGLLKGKNFGKQVVKI
jgi:NADPH-dependent curcumin reductase CurA